MRHNLPVTGREHPFPDGLAIVTVTDLQGRITYANPAFVEISGFCEAELLGQPHNLVRHPDMPPEAFRDLWATIEAGRPWSGLVKNRRKNGDHYWVHAHATPIVRDGCTVGYLSVRTPPQREQVQAAEALYARLAADAAAGRRRIALDGGRVVRDDALGRLLRRLRLGVPAQLALAALAATAGSALATLWQPLAGAAAALVAAVALTAFVRHRLVAPLARCVADARTLAAGDLTTRVATAAGGPVGELQQALAQMAANLRAIAGDVRAEVGQLRHAVAEIAAGNGELSARTESQAANLQQTAASMEQISGTARNCASAAAQGAQTAARLGELTTQGQAAVQVVTEAMAAIDASAQRMREVIGVVEGVAFQTNILALNAAVESARAGEAGRGFAVVASEVRALAQRSSEAAHDIKRLIAESAQRVQAGNTQTATAAQRMHDVVAAVQGVGGVLTTVSGATHEQQQGIAQVSEAVAQIDGITQQNAAMVEELAASAQALATRALCTERAVRLLRLHAGDATLAEADAVALRREGGSPQATAKRVPLPA
jgi:aerotaxis receptor